MVWRLKFTEFTKIYYFMRSLGPNDLNTSLKFKFGGTEYTEDRNTP